MTADTPHSTLPAPPRQDEKVPVHLERLAKTARDYARGGQGGRHPARLRRRLAPLHRLVPAQGA
jgi:hypothetical protein